MFNRFKLGLDTIWQAVKLFLNYPTLIVPVFIIWSVYAVIIIYLRYFFDFEPFALLAKFGIILFVIILLSLLFGIASLVVLELIQQIDSGDQPSIKTAVYDALFRDFLKSLPILLVWACTWFILSILSSLFSRKKDDDHPTYSARKAVGTLLGEDNQLSLGGTLLQALEKCARMVVYIILPAIAWEDLSTKKAIKKGFNVLRQSKTEFVIAFGLTEVFAFAIMLVPTTLVRVIGRLKWEMPELFWYAMIVYITLSISLIMIVELLYVSQIYLTYCKWERDCHERYYQNKSIPVYALERYSTAINLIKSEK